MLGAQGLQEPQGQHQEQQLISPGTPAEELNLRPQFPNGSRALQLDRLPNLLAHLNCFCTLIADSVQTVHVLFSQSMCTVQLWCVPHDLNCNWNDRRSHHVFLCFYSAIFQLTSAKFQTFAYNSKTAWSSYMKFWQQLEINELYVCTQFRGNRLRDFGFRTRKLPHKFGVKSGFSQKRLKYGKKYFIWLYVSRYPFIPTNPRLAAMKFISFLFPFFYPFFPFFSFFSFLNFVRSSSPKPQNMEI